MMTFRKLLLCAALATCAAPAIAAPGLPAPPAPGPLVQLAQADNRVQQLEEQVRALTGKVEELNFQLLQLQDQLRKMQEDNEFRFKEIEGKQGNAGPAAGEGEKEADVAGAQERAPQTEQGDGQQAAADAPAETPAASGEQQPAEQQQAGQQQATGEQPAAPAPAQEDMAAAGQPAPGGSAGEPQALGTIKFDENGNVIGGGAAQPGANASSGDVVAAISDINDPNALYQTAYELILAGDYANAEAAFGQHVQRFPENKQAADARYWLGEAQLGQNKFQQAAETFLNASKAFPKAKKAPDTLLKLGVALAGMNNRDLACATFAQVSKRYPDASAKLIQRLDEERQRVSC